MENKTVNMLVQIEKISAEATKCKLEFEDRIKNREAVEQVMKFFDITFVQAVLFSCILEISLERVASFEVLSRFLKCSVLKVIGLIDDIESLEKKTIIKKRLKHRGKPTYGNIGYFVPHNVIEALRTS